jgi:hypothetical protein
VANHLAAWIRANGFKDKRKAPNHAFRHWFKSACQKVGVLDSVADAIQGHAGRRGEADDYRHSGVAVMAAAIAQIPVPTAGAAGAPAASTGEHTDSQTTEIATTSSIEQRSRVVIA